MKLRKTFTVAGREYLAVTLKEAKAMHREEERTAWRMLDECTTPTFIPLADGRMIVMNMAFGGWGYFFVTPSDGRVSGGCTFGPHASRAEVERRAREHAAQYDAAA